MEGENATQKHYLIDKEELDEITSGMIVAKYLGMNIQKRGNYHFIKCPGHEARTGHPDKNATNCVLTKYGYHCFACNAKVDVYQMVQEVLKCSYYEALTVVADACGGVSLFEITNEKREILKENMAVRKRMPSQEMLQMIGLGLNKKHTKIIKASYASKEECSFSPEKEMIGDVVWYNDVQDHNEISLMLLAKEDPETFRWLIQNKCQDTMDQYINLCENYFHAQSKFRNLLPLLFPEVAGIELRKQMLSVIMKQYKQVRELYQYYGGENEKYNRWYYENLYAA